MAPPLPDMLVGHLKHFLRTEIREHDLSQSIILQHWLGSSSKAQTSQLAQNTAALNALKDAIIIGLDVEWFEHDPESITELGVCVLDPHRISPSPALESTWSILSRLQTHHLRIKRNTHLSNKDLCPGYPENFHFGTTTFASIPSAKEMLQSLFLQYDSHGYARPVLFLGHAIDNDYNVIKQRFSLDLECLGTIVATLDTQVLAREQGIAEASRAMRLKHLLEHYDIQEKYLHNAGNDVVATAVAALLMVTMMCQRQSCASAYTDLKTTLANTNSAKNPEHMVYGKSRFCTRCDSDRHSVAECTRDLSCCYCAADPERKQFSTQHKSDKCREEAKRAALERTGKGKEELSRKRYAVPCQRCVESRDPMRSEGSKAYGHQMETCPWF